MKKQDNPQLFDFLQTTIASFILIILVVAIGVMFEKLFDKESFTITKEECSNETIYIPLSCYYDENTTYVNFKACLDRGIQYKEAQREVCKQVEVDEITYKTNCNYKEYTREEYPEECSDIDYIYCQSSCVYISSNYLPVFKDDSPKFDLGGCLDKCGEAITHKTKKSQMTTDWLDENAECVENKAQAGKSYHRLEGFDCWKWKLGNYTIEVEE